MGQEFGHFSLIKPNQMGPLKIAAQDPPVELGVI